MPNLGSAQLYLHCVELTIALVLLKSSSFRVAYFPVPHTFQIITSLLIIFTCSQSTKSDAIQLFSWRFTVMFDLKQNFTRPHPFISLFVTLFYSTYCSPSFNIRWRIWKLIINLVTTIHTSFSCSSHFWKYYPKQKKSFYKPQFCYFTFSQFSNTNL